MDIVSRIKLFLNEYQIANSQFADKCDIPRPTISQLLNGRNKKVSDEVISKIHAAYPNLSIMWLMFGEEPMLLSPMQDDNIHKQENIDTESLEQNLFSNDTFLKKSEDSNRINFDTDISDTETSIYDTENENNNANITQTLEYITKNANKTVKATDPNVTNEKRIVNIMVFYSDNSFESFVPNK